MSSKNFIKLDNVSKYFTSNAGRFDALKNINLKISKGEYISIVGKSGSGKSTLLNMLTGIDHPSSGVVTIESTELHSLNETNLARWRGANIGIVFQFFQLIPTLSVQENILIALDFVNVIPEREKKERAMMLLDQVGISEHKDKFPAALSGGQQQRATIARALANDPPVIVADEPTGNLDDKTSQIVHALFEMMVSAGKTVIIVTHENISNSKYDRVISLRDGKIVSSTLNGAEV